MYFLLAFLSSVGLSCSFLLLKGVIKEREKKKKEIVKDILSQESSNQDGTEGKIVEYRIYPASGISILKTNKEFLSYAILTLGMPLIAFSIYFTTHQDFSELRTVMLCALVLTGICYFFIVLIVTDKIRIDDKKIKRYS